MNKEIIIGIYKITSPTGKIYIGYSTDIEERWRKYNRLGCKQQTYLYNSFLKHGVENHKFEIIYNFEKSELNKSEIFSELKKLEIYYVDFFNSFVGDNKNGLNLTRGGDTCDMSEETREKHSKSLKLAWIKRKEEGKGNLTEAQKEHISQVNKGKYVSPETREKQSKAHTGENNPMWGKKGKDSPMWGKRGKDNHNFGKKESPEHISMRISKVVETKRLKREARLEEERLIEEEKRIMIF